MEEKSSERCKYISATAFRTSGKTNELYVFGGYDASKKKCPPKLKKLTFYNKYSKPNSKLQKQQQPVQQFNKQPREEPVPDLGQDIVESISFMQQSLKKPEKRNYIDNNKKRKLSDITPMRKYQKSEVDDCFVLCFQYLNYSTPIFQTKMRFKNRCDTFTFEELSRK